MRAALFGLKVLGFLIDPAEMGRSNAAPLQEIFRSPRLRRT